MPYITPGQLCSYLGIDNPSAADTVQLGGFITAAQSIIDRQTGRTFEAAEATVRYLDARRDVDGYILWLGADCCQITEVLNGNDVEVTTGQYVTEPRNLTPFYAIRLRSDAGLTWTYTGAYENAIAVEGHWGYSLSAPADIQQATVRLAAYLYRQKDTGQELDRPLMVGDGNVILPAVLPNDVLTLIRPYRKFI